ncbi:cellulose-binding protein [Cellulomonas sp. A375-1]|uniref:cellulose-binding domain-containing protein n=1 Tax=Cellulomonas sp. A375-1 TaxID=1672219 RepID=UPI0006527006|nr:cellulose-binding domain-containing protein [Cellulomonas sp. A375-1]KMM46058.1 cellulose-binding protein [Cellulomonas sp. A375-1]
MHRTTRLWRTALAAVTAAAALIGTTLAGVAVGSAAQAAGSCQVAWSVNSWPGGFTADVRVTPSEATHGWRLTWTWPSGQRVTQSWSSTLTQSGSAVTVTHAPWNGELRAGETASFGFQGTWSGTNTAPTDFALDGVACNGGTTTSPSPSATPTPTPTPTPTQGPTPTPDPTGTPTECGTALFCDGLETQASSTPSGTWAVTYPDCSGSGRASVDSTVAHSGGKSLRVDGGAGYCNHVFVQAQPASALGSTVYVRFWVRHTTALPVQHTTYLAMRDANDGNRDLRMGGQNSLMQWNRSSDDATLPEQSPAGLSRTAQLPAGGSWHCAEALVEGATGRLTTWLDGWAVPGLIVDGTPTHDLDGQWLSKPWSPRLTDLRLGWESYGEGADTLWFDDVVVASTRVGC